MAVPGDTEIGDDWHSTSHHLVETWGDGGGITRTTAVIDGPITAIVINVQQWTSVCCHRSSQEQCPCFSGLPLTFIVGPVASDCW